MYGPPDETNGLLVEKVQERRAKQGGEGVVRTMDVWAVIEDLKREGPLSATVSADGSGDVEMG